MLFSFTLFKPKYKGNVLEIAHVLEHNEKAIYRLLLATNSSQEAISR
jgi:hypothetical protein